MNQKKANRAKRIAAEKEADKYFEKFEELLMNTYGIRSHGYQWENLTILDKSNPDYRDSKDYDIDNEIIQASISDAILSVCNAAFSLIDFGSEKRTRYFKTAIICCETLRVYEHVDMLSKFALVKNQERDFFMRYHRIYDGRKNINQDVRFDIDVLVNRLNEL